MNGEEKIFVTELRRRSAIIAFSPLGVDRDFHVLAHCPMN
jgi:hypothetical protein